MMQTGFVLRAVIGVVGCIYGCVTGTPRPECLQIDAGPGRPVIPGIKTAFPPCGGVEIIAGVGIAEINLNAVPVIAAATHGVIIRISRNTGNAGSRVGEAGFIAVNTECMNSALIGSAVGGQIDPGVGGSLPVGPVGSAYVGKCLII